jgi:hypothetical protein
MIYHPDAGHPARFGVVGTLLDRKADVAGFPDGMVKVSGSPWSPGRSAADSDRRSSGYLWPAV